MNTIGSPSLSESASNIPHNLDPAMLSWLLLGPTCESCGARNVVMIRIQYPDESATHYCLRCRPLTVTVDMSRPHDAH